MSKNNYEVIDQMFAAVLSANESEATIKALRPQVEEAVQALMREQGKPLVRSLPRLGSLHRAR